MELLMSVNNRLITELLTPCEYGFTLSCIIHRAVGLRLAFPTDPILQMKLDFKSAYRREHLDGDTAKQCTVTTVGLEDPPLALMSLRQTFGGAAGPPGFSDISSVITDLANALARLPPDVLAALPESIYKDKIGAPIFQDPSTPFATALPMRITPEADGNMTGNNYIDDIIGLFVAQYKEDPERAAKALMLAFEIPKPATGPERRATPTRRQHVTRKAICRGHADGNRTNPRVDHQYQMPGNLTPLGQIQDVGHGHRRTTKLSRLRHPQADRAIGWTTQPRGVRTPPSTQLPCPHPDGPVPCHQVPVHKTDCRREAHPTLLEAHAQVHPFRSQPQPHDSPQPEPNHPLGRLRLWPRRIQLQLGARLAILHPTLAPRETPHQLP